MEIFVKTLSGNTITVKVDPSDTIYIVMAKIQDQQCLVFGREELEDRLTLADYDIQDKSTLQLDLRPQRRKMLIILKALTGKDIALEVENLDTVDNVKAKIQVELNIPVDLQRLIFASRQMEDFRTMEEYGVKQQDIIHLVLRIRG
ncbi:hypothetical protein VPH35_135146 [Triticum aestivum]|uniref:polyubiquitin-like n=1 Tax=Triticum aestivum TaxID=4565 RepID=UPI00162F208E|nr:polyubiquitin-like [Triticum aestivum]